MFSPGLAKWAAPNNRSKQSRRPEANAAGEREKPVTAKTQLFADGHGKKYDSPAKGVTKNCAT